MNTLSFDAGTRFRRTLPHFSASGEIEVGGRAGEELLVLLEGRGVRVTEWGEELLLVSCRSPAPKRTVSFTEVPLWKLGFERPPDFRERNERIVDLGPYALCAPEDVPMICLALTQLELGEDRTIHVGMESVRSDDFPDISGVFEIRVCRGVYTLDAVTDDPPLDPPVTDRIIFRLDR